VPVHFVVEADYMTLGDWRPVIDAGQRNLQIKLLCYSKNSAASWENHDNLIISYKEDEKVAVMSVSWCESRYLTFSLHFNFSVLDKNQTIKGKFKFTPQIAWKSSTPELEQRFGMRANKARGNPIKFEKFI
jgi:hypothetical protein